jgi:hypothetical protein
MPIDSTAASSTTPSTLTVSSHNYTSSSFGPGTTDVSHGPPFTSSHVSASAPQGAGAHMHAGVVPPVWHSNPAATPSFDAVGATAFGLPREGVPMPPAAPVGAPSPAMFATNMPGHHTAAQPLSMYSDTGVNRSTSVVSAPGVGVPQQVSSLVQFNCETLSFIHTRALMIYVRGAERS